VACLGMHASGQAGTRVAAGLVIAFHCVLYIYTRYCTFKDSLLCTVVLATPHGGRLHATPRTYFNPRRNSMRKTSLCDPGGLVQDAAQQ
jgi:hypothetical protein